MARSATAAALEPSGMTDQGKVSFKDEEPERTDGPGPWKILIADDDSDVHSITRLALGQFTFDGRPLEFIDTYSGAETVDAMRRHPDTALALVDVVMETDSAGLDAIEAIRTQLGNETVRIVLRTGQPGQAPERDVVERYDINDYKEKTELTATKLFTLIYTGLSQYRDMLALQQERFGLQRVIAASARLFEQRTPQEAANAALQEFAVMLDLDVSPHHATDGGLAVENAGTPEAVIIASFGRFAGYTGQQLLQAVGPKTRSGIEVAPSFGAWRLDPGALCARLKLGDGSSTVLYLTGKAPLRQPQRQLLDLLCANALIALDNTRLNREVDRTQTELVFALSEAIEKRSNETGFHVRRVAEYSYVLARLAGLPEADAATLRRASPLHDAGKVAIPDVILNKPGRHTAEEKEIMDTHARLGSEIFKNQTLPVLQGAAIVASQHHERWDGLGYPGRLKGEDIHIFGRITALVDVFDALGSRRCYKDPWPIEEILELIRGERGKQFDPKLVDLFLSNIEKFLEVRLQYPDPAE